jgi:hypothetical protein
MMWDNRNPESAHDNITFYFITRKQTTFTLGDLFDCSAVHFALVSFLWPLQSRLCSS